MSAPVDDTRKPDTEARKPGGDLRKGWTTGACATAAATAAYEALVAGHFPDPVRITLPRGLTPAFALNRESLSDDVATVGIIKDAGDDPDVTHGAEIVAEVRRGAAGSGVTFFAGAGVGTVTLPGLPLAVGEPAINPKPREMIQGNLMAAAERLGGFTDIAVTVSIPDGELMAQKTMNGRLGIVGGLSVLGTTGVVVPYSCASWIHSIHRGVDVARAAGITHIAAATGSTSENAVRAIYGLGEQALIDMGDFAGGLLKYLREHPVPKLTIASGFGKMSKLAQGHMDLHSARSSIDLEALSRTAGVLGADADLQAAILDANTALGAHRLCAAQDIPLADAVARQAREAALAIVAGGVDIEVIIFDREGRMIGRTHNDFMGGSRS
ncbi:MAG: cobalt-precorrin-5B (C(1))-methyltransferase [Rhodospirillales bacterium]